MTQEKVSDILPGPKKLVLQSGREITLRPPTLKDIRDGEELLKKPFGSWFPSGVEGVESFSISTWVVFFYLLARKGWEATMEEMEAEVELHDVMQNRDILLGFIISGSGVGLDSSSEASVSDSE